MEYFLPLSVMAMIISSISIYLIDYKKPATSNAENDQPPSNPSDSLEDSADDFTASEKTENLQKSTISESDSENNKLVKIHSTQANLKVNHTPFSMLWNTTLNKKTSMNHF